MYIKKGHTIKWMQFLNNPASYKGLYKITKADGSYYILQYFSPYKNDVEAKKLEPRKDKAHKSSMRCGCGSVDRVVFVIPFDGSVSPGWYCKKCRKRKDILDIKQAKRYGKIF